MPLLHFRPGPVKLKWWVWVWWQWWRVNGETVALQCKERDGLTAQEYSSIHHPPGNRGLAALGNFIDAKFPTQQFTHKTQKYAVSRKSSGNFLPFCFCSGL